MQNKYPEYDIPKAGLGLRFLYHTVPGRILLGIFRAPLLSRALGRYMDSRYSQWLIPVFIKCNQIDLSEYEEEVYLSFNDFFTRHIQKDLRPISMIPSHFVSPCDGLLRVYPIKDGLVIPVKESRYSIASLLRDKKLADHYQEGTCLVFRLCVNHYHRYSYPDHGWKTENRFIPGTLHTVQPIALMDGPVFTENSREYTLLNTEHFGKIVQMEVGAMLVGKIENKHGAYHFTRGEEKGRFLYGGSTIILLLEKGQVEFPESFYEATRANREIGVKMGQVLGFKKLP